MKFLEIQPYLRSYFADYTISHDYLSINCFISGDIVLEENSYQLTFNLHFLDDKIYKKYNRDELIGYILEILMYLLKDNDNLDKIKVRFHHRTSSSKTVNLGLYKRTKIFNEMIK